MLHTYLVVLGFFILLVFFLFFLFGVFLLVLVLPFSLFSFQFLLFFVFFLYCFDFTIELLLLLLSGYCCSFVCVRLAEASIGQVTNADIEEILLGCQKHTAVRIEGSPPTLLFGVIKTRVVGL
jgi:hypothetical protein